MTNYRDLTEQGAAAAFEEFMAERGPALDRLRDRMAADGVYPSELLDGSVGSLVPLWRWVLTHLTKRDDPGATDPAMVPREQWPSWERYTWEEEPVLSLESLLLLDGVVSCLAAVVTDRAPTARWEVAHHKVKRYEFNNHPVLVGDGGIHNFLPALPLVEARATLLGVRQSPDDRISSYAEGLIEQLSPVVEPVGSSTAEPEPKFEVEDIRTEPGGYDVEIGLGEELAHERSDDVDRLLRELAAQDGVSRVIREDRDLILVRAPGWSAERVRAWLAARL